MLPGQISYPGQFVSPNVPMSVNLQSGAIFNIPAGSYQMKLGPQSVLQWNDDNSGLWRITDSGPSNNPIQVESDGSNFRVLNISGTIQGINITVAGTLYTQANTTMSFTAPTAVSGIPAITATATPIIGGSLTFAATSGGTGYTNPTFLIPPPQLCGGTPGLCLPATIGACTLTAGVISSPTGGFAGAGYVTAPLASSATTTITPAQFQANAQAYLNSNQIIIIDPAGTGAVITASLANGTATSGGLTGCVMTNPGAGYDGTHIPTVTITSATGGSAAATALPSMAIKSITVGSTNTGYTASALIMTSGGSGAAAIAGIFDEPVLVRQGRATSVQSGGVLATPLIEDAGNGFQTVPLAKQVGNATADGSVNATFTAVVGGVNNILLYWQLG